MTITYFIHLRYRAVLFVFGLFDIRDQYREDLEAEGKFEIDTDRKAFDDFAETISYLSYKLANISISIMVYVLFISFRSKFRKLVVDKFKSEGYVSHEDQTSINHALRGVVGTYEGASDALMIARFRLLSELILHLCVGPLSTPLTIAFVAYVRFSKKPSRLIDLLSPVFSQTSQNRRHSPADFLIPPL
jgi:hypothetical protein